MDTITQGLLGAATAQLGFRRKLGRGATWAAALTAMLPDLDIFAAPLMRAVGVEEGVAGGACASGSGAAVSVGVGVGITAAWGGGAAPRLNLNFVPGCSNSNSLISL